MSENESRAGERARCGCVIGGLHRYECAGVGHVDPPRPATPDADDANERAHHQSGDECDPWCPPTFPHHTTTPAVSTDASGALTEAEREALQSAVRAPQAIADDMNYVYAVVERIVAARESAAATRARAEGVAAERRLRDGIWALGESIHGEEGVQHNEGCEGEPECLACIVAELRRLLADDVRSES